jgi:primosomal protein N'
VDVLEAVRIKALLDVMEGDFPYHYRRICRWYSTTFHTPLAEVDSLPMDFVLQAFFENRFEDMSKAERKKLALEMTESEAEQKVRLAKEKAGSDEAFTKRIRKQAIKDAKKAKDKAQATKEAAAATIASMADQEMVGTPNMPDLPEISMSFDGSGNLIGNEESFGPPPRK